MLPGDYLAARMTGDIVTTASGLSEGAFWDFQDNQPAQFLLDYFGFDSSLIPTIKPTFAPQGELTASAAAELGLAAGTPVTYRAGDQPNNALSLNVLEPGQIAATAGTSGVVYGVSDQAKLRPKIAGEYISARESYADSATLRGFVVRKRYRYFE